MTAEQIIKDLTKIFSSSDCDSMDEFVYNKAPKFENIMFDEDEENKQDHSLLENMFNNLGEIDRVAQEETTSGDAYTVYHFVDHNVFIKIHGRYDSYESSTTYEDYVFSQVFPKEKTVVVYENK